MAYPQSFVSFLPIAAGQQHHQQQQLTSNQNKHANEINRNKGPGNTRNEGTEGEYTG